MDQAEDIADADIRIDSLLAACELGRQTPERRGKVYISEDVFQDRSLVEGKLARRIASPSIKDEVDSAAQPRTERRVSSLWLRHAILKFAVLGMHLDTNGRLYAGAVWFWNDRFVF